MNSDTANSTHSNATPEESLAKAKELIAGLGERIGIPDLELEQSAYIELTIQDDTELMVFVLAEMGVLIAGSPIADPAEIDAETMLRMLDYNRQFPALSTGTFSIPTGSDFVVYSIMLPIKGLTVELLDQSLSVLGFASVRMQQLLRDIKDMRPEPSTHETVSHYA